MNTHLSEEDLVLIHYGESSDPERTEHLESCATCQAEAARLAKTLSLVEITVPEPDEEFEERTWSRLAWRMRGEEKRAKKLSGSVAAAAALILTGLLAGLWINRPATPVPDAAVASSSEAAKTPRNERVLLLVVSEHLDRTERVLVELSKMVDSDRHALGRDKQFASDLVAANRLYRISAADRDPKLNALLEEIEPILIELSHAPAEMTSEDLETLQTRIDERSLIFKLRVSGARVRSQQKTTVPNI